MGARNIWFIAGLALAISFTTSCKKSEGGACFEVSDCADGLACIGGDGDLKRCEKCDGSATCTADGKCSVKDGTCVAASNEDCKKGYLCTGKGACTAKDGKCTVGGDADCQQSEACKSQGYCKSKGNNCVKDQKTKDKEKAEKEKAAKEAEEAEEGESKADESAEEE